MSSPNVIVHGLRTFQLEADKVSRRPRGLDLVYGHWQTGFALIPKTGSPDSAV